MKTAQKLFAIMVLSLFLGACVSTGAKYTEMAETIPPLEPGKGRIYMYRTTSFGMALQPKIKLNGEAVSTSVAKGFSYVDKAPGNYEIMTSTEVDRKLTLTLEKGQTRFVRFDVSMGFFAGHVYPKLVEPEVGKKEIQICGYVEKLK